MKRKLSILVFSTLLIVLACNLPAGTIATATVNPAEEHGLPAETVVVTEAVTVPAEIIPTEDPITPSPTRDEGSDFCKIVYSNGGSVYCTAPGRTPILLGNIDQSVYNLSLSADRTLLVYMASSPDGVDALWLAHTNGAESPKVLIAGGQVAGPDPTYKTAVSQAAWLADSHILYFTTRTIYDGPGEGLNVGIWKVDADSGEVSKVFDPEARCHFFISPNGARLVLSMSDQIQLADINGNGLLKVLTFEPVITYSEYALKPRAQWRPDSQSFYLVVPSVDPLASDASASFYQVGMDGVANKVMTIPGNFLFGGTIPAEFSPDGNVLLYSINDGSNNMAIHLVNKDGSNDRIVATVSLPIGYGWSPDSTHYVYTADGQGFIVEQGNSTATPFVAQGNVMDIDWLNAQTLVYQTLMDNSNAIYTLEVGGSSTLLAGGLGDTAYFTVGK